jgi:hypothetical protein
MSRAPEYPFKQNKDIETFIATRFSAIRPESTIDKLRARQIDPSCSIVRWASFYCHRPSNVDALWLKSSRFLGRQYSFAISQHNSHLDWRFSGIDVKRFSM